MIRILIVAGIRLYREGLALMLERHGGFAIVGTRSHRQQISDVPLLGPDVVLVDMATVDSEAIVRDIRSLCPQVALLALGVSDVDADVLASLEAGASGYVSREGSIDDLVAGIESAARGELQCSPRIAGTLLRRVGALLGGHEPHAPGGHLTVREQEIVTLIVRNLSNKEIATYLGIEVATVKNHVHNLLEKLHIHRRVDVARCVSVTPPVSFGVASPARR